MGSAHRQLSQIVLLLAFLGGCAVDCTDQNWRERGYLDGFGGAFAQDLRIAPACGAAFSESQYMEGYRDGHDEYERLRSMRDD
jgi:hypothetical protein